MTWIIHRIRRGTDRQGTVNLTQCPAVRVCGGVAAVVAVLLLTSCGGSIYQPTMTQQHASARSEQLIRDTANGITPRPRLVLYQGLTGVNRCLVEQDDPRSQVTRTYVLSGIGDAKASIGEQILRLWKREGFTINDTLDIGTSGPLINAATPDDFLIGLDTTGTGDLSIETSSPCLWPNGTPPPKK